MKLRYAIAVLALLLAGCQEPGASPTAPIQTAAPPPTAQAAADFDYYLLALSWAPDYCAANPNDSQECALGRKYGFVLHGLWPQYQKGYPSDCGSEPLPAQVKAQFSGLFPNEKLFEHEWSKHGTCSGLPPAAYLALAKRIKESVQIPAAYQSPAQPFRTDSTALKDAFLQANPGLAQDGLAVSCSGSGRFLSELQVCFTTAGAPASCGADVQRSAQKSCGQASFLVRNTW